MKVSRAGTSITSTSLKDLAFDSEHSMFKFHSVNNGTISLTTGGTQVMGTISHTLGYVPAFVAYVNANFGSGTTYYPVPGATPNHVDAYPYPFAYAGTAGIVYGVVWPSPYNVSYYVQSGSNDLWDSYYNSTGFIRIGKNTATGESRNGAMRFTEDTFTGANPSIDGSADVGTATITFEVNDKGTSSSDVKFVKYGIDEDDTGDFSSDPMGRTKTTAVGTQTQSLSPSVPFDFGIDVTSQTREITDRAGWDTGNALGYIFLEQDCPTGASVYNEDETSVLKIYKPGTAVFKFKVIIFKDKIV